MVIAVGLGTTTGAVIGMVSAYFGGKLDYAVQRFMDMLMAFPMLVLALAMVADSRRVNASGSSASRNGTRIHRY